MIKKLIVILIVILLTGCASNVNVYEAGKTISVMIGIEHLNTDETVSELRIVYGNDMDYDFISVIEKTTVKVTLYSFNDVKEPMILFEKELSNEFLSNEENRCKAINSTIESCNVDEVISIDFNENGFSRGYIKLEFIVQYPFTSLVDGKNVTEEDFVIEEVWFFYKVEDGAVFFDDERID